jgi:hypothetical protein
METAHGRDAVSRFTFGGQMAKGGSTKIVTACKGGAMKKEAAKGKKSVKAFKKI